MAKKKNSKKAKQPFWKNVWVWVLAGILMIGACNDTGEPSEDPNGTTAPSTSYIAETTAPTTTPETTIPETTAFETTAPETTAPETTVPKSSTPKATTPKPTDPKPTDPESTVAETVAPETTVPETTEPNATSAPSGNQGSSSSDANQNTNQGGSDSSQHTYIVNKSTEKFHYPYCSSVKTMNEKNKWEFTGTREELINMDYKPCGICNP